MLSLGRRRRSADVLVLSKPSREGPGWEENHLLFVHSAKTAAGKPPLRFWPRPLESEFSPSPCIDVGDPEFHHGGRPPARAGAVNPGIPFSFVGVIF
jgi:hypothetical protein